MLDEHDKRDNAHLTNLIGRRSSGTPNFALLIGAGACASSGVKTASQMIEEWRRELHLQSKRKEPLKKWLQKQDWYEDDEEYSILFERVCDQRSQRRICIEDCVKDARPSWGYIYLSNIIAHNYFNVVLTPNFDDLLNEACFVYAGLRPLVCAHDSAVGDIRVTSARPKIIKLHGDYLYDSIKNTIAETETLEKNMRDKFMQFGMEYGLVVVGYGGNDRSIMDTLDMMLRSDGYFPNGLYWCVWGKNKVSRKLARLMRRENAYLVEIEGFDEYMAELHAGLGLTLPDTVRDPYRATTESLNRVILPTEEVKHPVIKADIAELEEQVKTFEDIISKTAPPEEFDRFVPYEFLGDRESVRDNWHGALPYYEKALIQSPGDLDLMGKIFVCHKSTEEFEKAYEVSAEMTRRAPRDYRGYHYEGEALSALNRVDEGIASLDRALKRAGEEPRVQSTILASRASLLLLAGQWQRALADAERALQLKPRGEAARINKCIALKNLGKTTQARKILQAALPEIEDAYMRACALAVLGDRENMLKQLEAAIKEQSEYRVNAKIDPDFVEYREDADFRKLVYQTG